MLKSLNTHRVSILALSLVSSGEDMVDAATPDSARLTNAAHPGRSSFSPLARDGLMGSEMADDFGTLEGALRF